MLDALADLFLTGTAGGAPASAAATPAAAAVAAATDPLDAPAPIRLPPKLRAPAPAGAAPLGTSHGAAAPARAPISTAPAARPLRLVPDAAPETATPAAPLRLEAVLLGHLPGFAGPWLTQYAQHVAQRCGPVALVHWGDQGLEIDLVRAGGNAPARAAGAPEPDASPVEVLDRLRHDAAAPLGALLVRLDDPARAAGLHLSRLTIVCGAHDAAVVDAYQKVKTACDSGWTARLPEARFALMVMGADENRARAAAAKLNAATTGFLHAPVELAGWQQRMTPVVLMHLADFAADQRTLADMAAYLEELAATEGAPVAGPPLSETPAPPAPGPAAAPAVAAPASADSAPRPEPSVVTAGPDPAALRAAAVPGAVALEARCPRQPEVQLLLDQSGRLHLLRAALTARAGAAEPSADALRAAIVDLLEAQRWTREHLPLLQLTQRQCRFDPAAAPVLHLLADQGKLAAALATRLGDLLCVHLLQQARAGAETAWVSTPLN